MFFVGNWKNNQSPAGAREFIEKMDGAVLPKGAKVVVCPQEAFLSWPEWDNLPVALGAQDATPIVLANPKVKYCLVGHSDRRRLGESETDITQKIALLLEKGITPLLCFSKKEQYESYKTHKTYIFCFEPPENISQSGQFKTVNPQKVEAELGQRQKDLGSNTTLLYGGSVNVRNINALSKIPHLSGFLVGQASLKANEFLELIHAL